jgi:hypothetical protein
VDEAETCLSQKKTNLFAIFVAVLVAATYYFEFYKSQKDEAQKSEESLVVAYPLEQIHQLTVENAKGKVLLKRDADGWTMLEPLKDWADNQFVEDYIGGLVAERSTETAAEGDKIDWSVYGLDKNPGKITFTNQQGSSILIQVSPKKNFEGNSFLRRNEENKVMVATSQWVLRSQSAVMDFRDKRLFRGKIGSVEEISVKSGKDDFKLIQKDNKWQSEKYPDLKLDQNKVREILTSLNEIQAVEFLPSLPAAEQKAKLTLKLKDKTWSADLKQGKDKMAYAQVSDPAFSLKLQTGQPDKFFDMTLISLRDRKEPFDFKNLLVSEIEIQTPMKKWTLQKQKESWKLVGDDKAVIDEKNVRNFITHLSDSAVTEYLDKSEQSKFAGANQRLILRDEAKQVLFSLTWGPTLKKNLSVGDKTLVLAQSNLFKDVFGLDQSVIDSWGLMSLLPVENKPKKETP